MSMTLFLMIVALIVIYHLQDYLKTLLITEYTLDRAQAKSNEIMSEILKDVDEFDEAMDEVPGLINPN